MGVFRNDFAAVDVREELCYHSRPKEANSRGVTQKREIERLYNEENQKGNKPVEKKRRLIPSGSFMPSTHHVGKGVFKLNCKK